MVDLSRASYRKMLRNLIRATGYNVIAVPLAAGVLAFAGVALSPAVAAALMSGVHHRRGSERPNCCAASSPARAAVN